VQKQKALVFYTYLPPWRIDVFNEMATYFDMTIIFLNSDGEGFVYNREVLAQKLISKYIFWNKGFKIGTKAFRIGILSFINQYKPEVVFSHEYSPTSLLLSLFLRLGIVRFKLIVTTSDNVEMSQKVSGLKRFARSFVLTKATGIVVYSKPVKAWYEREFKHLKVEICPNIQNPQSILTHAYGLSLISKNYKDQYALHDLKVILFVGRLVKVKGLDLLISAISKVENQSFKLILVGEGKEKENLRMQAMELGLADKVIFAGHFNDVELYAWYTVANFFILPSRFEPFGAVVNEALILGCPVIASRYIGALEYIEDEVNGLVFDPLDEKEFLAAINYGLDKFNKIGYSGNDLMRLSFFDYVKNIATIVYL
jgi:glycosyltransferase involved in cell wall biosynthesis